MTKHEAALEIQRIATQEWNRAIGEQMVAAVTVADFNAFVEQSFAAMHARMEARWAAVMDTVRAKQVAHGA